MLPIRPGFQSTRFPATILPRTEARFGLACIVWPDWGEGALGWFRAGPGWHFYSGALGAVGSVDIRGDSPVGPTVHFAPATPFLQLFDTVVIAEAGPPDRVGELVTAIQDTVRRQIAVYVAAADVAAAQAVDESCAPAGFFVAIETGTPAAIQASHECIAELQDAFFSAAGPGRVGAIVPVAMAHEFRELALQVWDGLEPPAVMRAGADAAIARGFEVAIVPGEPRSGDDARLVAVLHAAARAGRVNQLRIGMPCRGGHDDAAGFLYHGPTMRDV